jgi:hypothetical protein
LRKTGCRHGGDFYEIRWELQRASRESVKARVPSVQSQFFRTTRRFSLSAAGD